MIRFEVDASGALNRMARLSAESKDRRAPNRELSIQLYGFVLRNFNSSGSLQKPAWRPLKASTLKQKQRQGYSSQPLIRTGHYRQSFRSFYTNDTAGVGSEVPYSKFHEDGTRHLPARRALPSKETALDFAVRIYDRWVAKLAR